MSRNYPYRHKLRIATGCKRFPKFRVFDLNGNSTFTLASGTYEIKNNAGTTLVAETAATVNNSDTDSNGNTIKTIMGTFDASVVTADGVYSLILKVVLTTSESAKFSWPVQVFTPGVAGRGAF